jgi:plastocyanin
VITGPRRVRRLASGPVIAAVVSLMVSASTLAQDASPAPSSAPQPSPVLSMAPVGSPAAAIPVTLADFTVTPVDLVATTTTVSFAVVNDGPTPHNLTIRDSTGTVLGATPDLGQGGQAVLTITLPAAGSYITYCSLPGHESLGLKGTLTVTEGGVAASPVAPSPMASAAP